MKLLSDIEFMFLPFESRKVIYYTHLIDLQVLDRINTLVKLTWVRNSPYFER